MLSNFVSPYDAHVVEQLNAAGAVNLGKTNMDEFAMGSSSETSFYGPVQESLGRGHRARRQLGRLGGGGGGAARAGRDRHRHRRLDPAAGGALRHLRAEAHLRRGVALRHDRVRLQPRPGRADGAHARRISRCCLNVMAGFDARDSTSLDREREDYTRDLGKPLQGLKIGLPKEFFAEGAAPDVAKAVEAAVAEFRKLGCETVEVSLPNMKLSVPVYYVLAPAEASSNLARYDGVRYGYRAPEYADLIDMYKKTRAQGFGAEVKRRILIGTYVLSHGYYDAYYIQAQRVRRLIARDFAEAFKRCDVIMGPTSPTTAFRLGEKMDDPVQMYLNDIYTIPANLAGLPGMSIPCGFDGKGLPVGLQIIGNYFAEARMLNVAHQYQQATDWHARAPAGIE